MDYTINRGLSIEHRLRLQSLSYFIYNGDRLNVCGKNTGNFKVREQLAYVCLEKSIHKICGEELSEQIEDIIGCYFDTKNQIYFNIGMKAGATLIVNLTKDFDND